MKMTASTTYLTYSMISAPNPLEVSPSPQSPSVATFTFVASCPLAVGSCTIGQIIIALPVGDPSDMDATDLTDVTPPLSAASVSSSDGAVWTAAAGMAAGVFVFTPQSGPVLIEGQSLTFIIAGIQISPLVGTADIAISEWGAPSTFTPPAPPRPASGQAVIAAAKFPYGFYAFDFAPSSPQVNSGEAVTLTWVGSSNADFTIAYNDQTPVDVSTVRTWTSPPLYTTTTFILDASASVAGQTVGLDLGTTVIVASPQVVSFYPDPNQIDYNQTVTLNWRAIDADGVYLLTGQTQRQTLAAVSDPANPVTLQPQYAGSYSLQAFKNQDGTQIVSSAVPLSFTFNPIDFVNFSANPTTVDLQNQSTVLSWEVDHAVNVYFNGGQVNPKDQSTQNPTSPSSYSLSATWVDGSSQSAPNVNVDTVQVEIGGVNVGFTDLGQQIQVTVQISAANATSGVINNASLMYSDRHHWYIWGNHWQSAGQSGVAATLISDNLWQFQLTFDIDPNVTGFGNVGFQFDWNMDGFVPVGQGGVLAMWRGSFTFWDGS